MSVIRFLGRALFAAPYMVDGYHLITRPERDEERITSTVDRVLPLATTVLPDAAASRLPIEPRTWTRILGGVQVAGAAAYATGVGRRAGAWVLTLASLPRLGAQDTLVRDLGMLGAAVVATQDTEGKPSMAWRAAHSAKRLGSQAADTAGADQGPSSTMVTRVAALGTTATASAARASAHLAAAGRLLAKATTKVVNKVAKELEH